MVNVSVPDFIDYAKRSQVVCRDELQAALKQLSVKNDGKIPRNVDTVAEFLVNQGLLTEWQSNKIKEGKYRGFFLGKYKLLGHLGSGGMSSVYLAEHTKMRRRVAVKVLPRKRVSDSSYLERFYREAQAAAALDHPNIVRAYDIDTDESGIHYLVMEYLPGSDLKKVAAAENQPLEIERVVHYISQAAAGLQHAHQAGLVHRDVKPANLLVDSDHQLKVLDLGLALMHDEPESLTKAHDEKVFGTADYLAPEQALDSHLVDARVDVYALGCTFYYALVGHAPFPQGTLAQRIALHQTSEPVPIDHIRKDCPPSLVEVCQRMMCKRPQDRYQSSGDVHDLLVSWLAQRNSCWTGTYRITSDSAVGNGQGKSYQGGEDNTSRAVTFPFVVADSESRVAKHRERGQRKKKKTKTPRNASPVSDGRSAVRPIPAADEPTVDPRPSADSLPVAEPVATSPAANLAIVTQRDEKPLLQTRRDRIGRAKKPPVGLWVFLAAMVLLAIGLAIVVVLGGYL